MRARPRSFHALTLVVALATVVGGCFWYNQGPSTKQLQRRALHSAEPAPLEATHPWQGEPRVIKVRVWVDEDFRAQNLRWKAEIEEQIDEANQFLVPALGLQLEVVVYEAWAERSASRSMQEMLDALEAKDAGADVGWVIGYVSSLSIAAVSFEQLGVARPLSKHLVMRGFADADERKLFARVFDETSGAEREVVHQARRRHKQTTILIHELGHTLGGIHENDAGWIMHGTYSVDMSQLSDRSRELMMIALEDRALPAARQDPRALAGRMIGYLDANPWGGWDEDDRRELMGYLRQTMNAAPVGTVAGNGATPGDGSMNAPDISLPAAAYDQLKHAQALAAKGQAPEALAELEALVAAYPGTAELRQTICEVHIGATGPASPATVTACERAAEISPTDPRPYLARVEAFLRADDRAHALELLAQVEARAGERAPVWDRVAAIYQATGRVTEAEAAAARSTAAGTPGVHPVTEWATRTRARYGLPPDAKRWKIAPADEGAYVLAVRELLDLIYAGKTDDAKAKAAAAERRWKGAPGILAARCDLHLRQGDRGTAHKLCAQAVAGWAGTAWAHYLEGVIGLQEHKDARAIASLRKAIAADPELAQAYRALGKALVRGKDEAGWTALAETYQRRFGSALPR